MPNMPVGGQIPVGARMLAICDTYDSITQDRSYRKGESSEVAFAELRRCSGDQFDPELVEQFIKMIQDKRLLLESKEESGVSKQSALRIGLLMDSMTHALESGNTKEIREQAQSLSLVATEARLEAIAEISDELGAMAETDNELEDLVQMSTTLLDLCRMTQRAYVGVRDEQRELREKLAKRQFED